MPRCLVIRYGGFGDAIQASSILPGLKAQGFTVTVDVSEAGELALRHDPNIAGFLVTPHGSVPHEQLGDYWNARTNGFHKVVNLCESVECAFLQTPRQMGFYRDDEARRRLYGAGNYVEHIHRIAGVPGPFRPWYYPTEAELVVASVSIAGRRAVALCLAGSTEYKIWPHAFDLVGLLIASGHTVYLLGGREDAPLAKQIVADHAAIDCTGMPFRAAAAIACEADVVIGPETGILNCVATRPNRKVVLLSHSNPANLTRDWVNTKTLVPSVACHPCHRLHQSLKFCPRGPSGEFAACAESIAPGTVIEAMRESA